jgi:outer membrane immunogenic protein
MLRCILLALAGAMALLAAARAAEPLAPPAPPAPPIWTGFYAGANAGYAFGGSNDVDLLTGSVFFALSPDAVAVFGDSADQSGTRVLSANNSGFIGGGQVGYNYQFANFWVAGVETDIQGTGARASSRAIGIVPDPAESAINGFPVSAVSSLFAGDAVDYLGTVRGRLGFLVTPSLLIFAGAGFAYGGVHQDINVSTTFPPTPIGLASAFGGFTSTRPGWVAGGGLEWMFMPNWSAKLEYLYYDLGTTNFAAGVQTLSFTPLFPSILTELTTARTRWNGNIARAGLNYHFNW